MARIDWRLIGISLLVSFFMFQLVSIILGNFFPTFATITRAYSLIWTWILFFLIILLVGYMIVGIRNFDKKSLFIALLSLAVLSFIVIYFKINLGNLFDMDIAQRQAGSIVNTIGSIFSP